MSDEDDLRAVMAEHLDYVEVQDVEGWYPEVFCVDCQLGFPASWGDFDEHLRVDVGNPWRVAAEHWIQAHAGGSE